ncbi:chaperonin 10-like protein [Xylogone sp. PMI_703]|nr:chaperonin 10-like protein [Xylogone sp. PMI_703]
MKTQNAIVGAAVGQYQYVHDAQIPTVQPDMVLCKVAAVALNPTDWKMVDFSVVPGAVGGHDFAGEVLEVGSQVTRFKKGDRVFALTLGLNDADKTTGCFGQYATALEDVTCKLPDGMSYEDAATFGVGVGTTGLGLYQAFGLPTPGSLSKTKPFPVLVSGGATATGTLAVQFLKASGLTPIVTCSPEHIELVKSLGAVEAFDYHSPRCGADIRSFTENNLAYAFDCITEAASMKMCYEAIGSEGGKYIGLEPFSTHIQYTRRDVKAGWLMARTLFGKVVHLDGAYGRPAHPQDREFAARWYPLAEQLLAQGQLKPHPIEVRTGGLEALLDGIEDLRKGRVRAKKLVYPIV